MWRVPELRLGVVLMAGVTLEYSINDHQALAMLEQLEGFDSTSMFEEIGEHLVSATQGRFRDQVDPEGNDWKPSKRALRTGDLTLIDHAILRGSITYNASTDQVEVGTNLVYGAIHQFGGEAGRNLSVTLPARPYLGISDDDGIEIDDIVEAHLEDTMR